MDMSQLLRALGLQQAYQAYQQNIGEPFAAVVGGAGRGYLGLDKPEYGGLLSEESYRMGQAMGNMPAIGAPAGAFKAAAQAPGLLSDAAQFLRNLSPEQMGLLGITAFHGSPHRFSKFDASKIGTGEGFQAYGHGLYFAENPNVANEYRRTSRNMNPSYDGIELNDTVRKTAAEILLRAKGDKTAAIKEAERYAYDNLLIPEINKMDPSKVSYGAFYTVDIPDEMVGRMLDWDKPLSQQSKTIQDIGKSLGLDMDDLGGDLVNAINAKRPEGAEKLRQAGIPGIRYYDAQSRDGKKSTTQNIVVFPGEEEAIKMLSVD
jgi:hypothetical protein